MRERKLIFILPSDSRRLSTRTIFQRDWRALLKVNNGGKVTLSVQASQDRITVLNI